MNKNLLLLAIFISLQGWAQKQKNVITQDVANFWKAYDKITLIKDSLEQVKLINSLYIQKGTPGLAAIMEARQYTPEQYIHAINHYPEFWHSVKASTLKADRYAAKIEKGIDQLKNLYPQIKPAKIYFTIGVLRTNGTTKADKVLIGSEVAMTDKNTVTRELGKQYSHLRAYFDSEPIQHLDFLNIHEYIHTQQKSTVGYNLLAQTVMEGVAEFLAEKALNTPSPNPQIKYGKSIEEKLKPAFTKDMLGSDFSKWLWNSPDNEFKMRDLGYFIGYAICENYYNLSADKQKGIKEMIELDYNNEKALFDFVDKAEYFTQPLSEYNEMRPVITGIRQFSNKAQNVNPGIKTITLIFSTTMNIKSRGFDYGPLGEENVLRVQKVIGFSEDKKTFSFEVALEPGKRYQSVVTAKFTDENGYPLKPFLIDFKTSDQ